MASLIPYLQIYTRPTLVENYVEMTFDSSEDDIERLLLCGENDFFFVIVGDVLRMGLCGLETPQFSRAQFTSWSRALTMKP